MELSKRLEAVASLADPGETVADVGCDHGYVGIWLIQQKLFSKVIAMDVRPGPLEAARKNIQLYQVEDQIEIRLSDGLDMLSQGEADCMICAGMGGALTCRILNHHLQKVKAMKQVILQPQSELHLVRKFLRTNGFLILREEIVMEDGKYYPMMKAVPCMAGAGEIPYSEEELEFGRVLLQQAHPVLGQFLEREMEIQNRILSALESQESVRAKKRMEEISYRIEWIRGILNTYY